MGTRCHVAVLGGTEADLDVAQAEIRALEGRWSRFLPDSDVGRLNAAGGAAVEVDASTRELVRRGVEGRTLTDGWFDPFLGREIIAAGYDRDIGRLPPPAPGGARLVPAIGEPLRLRAPVVVDDDAGTIRLLDGAAFDPGGFGKGRAADLVGDRLLARGVSGALVNLGGDLRVVGAPPSGGWRIDVEDPFVPEPLDAGGGPRRTAARVELHAGGLCTSSPLKRRWRTVGGSPAHHVIDPRNGRPGPVEVASVTVTAAEAWAAEVLATAVLLAGPVFGAALLRRARAEALVVGLDGSVRAL